MATLTGKGTSYSFSINIPLDIAKVENILYFCLIKKVNTMGTNKCNHEWERVSYGLKCKKCPEIILNDKIKGIPGILLEEADIEVQEDSEESKGE